AFDPRRRPRVLRPRVLRPGVNARAPRSVRDDEYHRMRGAARIRTLRRTDSAGHFWKATHMERTYIPAAGHDFFLPIYDPLTRLLGVNSLRRALVEQAGIEAGHRV